MCFGIQKQEMTSGVQQQAKKSRKQQQTLAFIGSSGKHEVFHVCNWKWDRFRLVKPQTCQGENLKLKGQNMKSCWQ